MRDLGLGASPFSRISVRQVCPLCEQRLLTEGARAAPKRDAHPWGFRARCTTLPLLARPRRARFVEDGTRAIAIRGRQSNVALLHKGNQFSPQLLKLLNLGL